MDPFQLLLWVVVIGTGAGVLAYHRRRMQETAAVLRSLAMREGGRVIDGTLLRWPRLEIQHGARSVALFPVSGGQHSPDRTVVEINAASLSELRLIVQERRAVTMFARDRHLQEISVGEPTFDDAFLVQGDPDDLVRAIFTSEAQTRLLRLRKQNPRVRLKDGRLSLSIDRIPREVAGFEELIIAATTLCGAVSATPPERGWPGDRPAASRGRKRRTGGVQRRMGRPSVTAAVGLAVLVTGTSLVWMAAHAPAVDDQRAIDPTLGDLSNHSYSGQRGRVLGINADGAALRLDQFEGAFLWVDMEGPWCDTSNTQAQTIRALAASRHGVTFLTLVTSDHEPLSTPDQGSARRWASAHGLAPAHVVAYDSTMTVPHHILYSPTGQTLLRRTGYLPPDQLQALLDDQVRRWHAQASAE
jgi:hypothetical protein